jgi:hypothetical protein
MGCHKRIGWLGVIFLVLFLLVSLPKAVNAGPLASDSGSAPVLVAAQEATIPLAAHAVTGAAETERPYKLTFKMGALFLRRGDNKSLRLMDVNIGPPEPFGGSHTHLDAGDLDLGWAPGMDTSIMLQNKGFGIEVRYMGLLDWSKSKTNSDYNLGWDAASASGKFKSMLNNVELNLHWWPCANDRYNLLMGFRWLRLKDRLTGIGTTFQATGGPDYFESYGATVSCRNQLWGGQVGAEGLLFGKRDQGFSLDGGVKAGVFANKIRNKGSEYGGWGYGADWYSYGSYSDSWNRTKTAFLSELGLNLNYAFTKNIAMTLGYELLYVSKVAVPVNDWASTQHALYQGSRVGLNFSF